MFGLSCVAAVSMWLGSH